MNGLPIAIAVAAALFVGGCGGDSERDGNGGSTRPATSQTGGATALTEACDSIGEQLPPVDGRGIVGWGRAVREAEHYAASDDSEVRDLANDFTDFAGQFADAESGGATMSDVRDLQQHYRDEWPALSSRCGWR